MGAQTIDVMKNYMFIMMLQSLLTPIIGTHTIKSFEKNSLR
ncbi:Uncharacterised protein [Enterobacter hormaechei]|nr:Uncharacterised protein [Enterobacter hormaechei]